MIRIKSGTFFSQQYILNDYVVNKNTVDSLPDMLLA